MSFTLGSEASVAVRFAMVGWNWFSEAVELLA
jgi:hypothetical protein